MSHPRSSRATGLLAAGVTALMALHLAYGALRWAEWALLPRFNPIMLQWTEHSPFVWRTLAAAYAGGMAAFLGYVWHRARPEHWARWLPRVMAASLALAALQIALVP